MDFIKQLNNAAKAMEKIPVKAGAEAVRFFKNSWREQAWIDTRVEPWKKRRNKSKKNKGRGILIQSGRLKRSIRVAYRSGSFIVIANDVPYARAHNEGFKGTVTVKAHKRKKYTEKKVGTGVYNIRTRKERKKRVTEITGQISVKSHTRKMNLPKRQFMGESHYLSKRFERIMLAELNKVLK